MDDKKVIKKAVVKKVKKVGIGAMAISCLKQKMTFEKAEKLIKAKFPGTKFNRACYAWYKNHMSK